MEYVSLNNGVKMPILGYGVYQVTKEECERCVLDALKLDTGRLIQHRVILMRKRLGMQSKSQAFQEKKSSLQQRCGLNIMDMKKQRNQFLNP